MLHFSLDPKLIPIFILFGIIVGVLAFYVIKFFFFIITFLFFQKTSEPKKKSVNKKINLILVLIVSTLLLTGCGCQEINEYRSPELIVKLADSPGNYEKVNIDVTGLQATVNGSLIDLEVNKGIYNLLDFTNGGDTVLVGQEIKPGELSQLRLILGENNSVVINKVSYPLKTPSAQQSGLKLKVNDTFIPDITYEYILDFDANRSVVKTGNQKYILKPVINVYVNALTGVIQGVVTPANYKPSIYAISVNEDTLSTRSDTITGKFKIRGLSPGSYNVSFVPIDPYKKILLSNILVKAESIVDLDTVKLN